MSEDQDMESKDTQAGNTLSQDQAEKLQSLIDRMPSMSEKLNTTIEKLKLSFDSLPASRKIQTFIVSYKFLAEFLKLSTDVAYLKLSTDTASIQQPTLKK